MYSVSIDGVVIGMRPFCNLKEIGIVAMEELKTENQTCNDCMIKFPLVVTTTRQTALENELKINMLMIHLFRRFS